MQLHEMRTREVPRSVFKVEPPPLWYVTDGELTVGPVVTDQLVRGVEYGRIPDDCQVRLCRGPWRTLDAVREICAVSGTVHTAASMEAAGQEIAEWLVPVERMRDEMEFCHTAAWLGMIATGAESAMVHYRNRSANALFTRAVVGPMSHELLGHPLPENDLPLRQARLGRPVQGPPFGPTEDALAMRFATSQGGSGAVAMIPMFLAGRLRAMLELSRPGHAFRRMDLLRAERIVYRILRQRAD